MPYYEISWTEELEYMYGIEADSEEHARKRILEHDFDWPMPHWSQVQHNIQVESVNE